jgi:glycosyltransferase involved in cell wall biosynthesis
VSNELRGAAGDLAQDRALAVVQPPQRPRVLIVLRSFVMGGAQRQATLIANGLHRRGLAAIAVWAFEPGPGVGRLLAADIPTRVIHPGSEGSIARRARLLARYAYALRCARPDVLLPFTDFPNRVTGAVWPLTGAAACVWNQRDEGREVTRHPLERLAIRQCSTFVANSAVGRQHLVSTFGVAEDRISIIPNGVSPPEPMPDRAAARRAFGVDAGALLAVMVANLHGFKDHETLVRAWRLVVDAREGEPVLLLAGRPGDAAERIRGLCVELGVARSIRLLSSRREGCPNAVLEAMAAGLPVVATDIVGTREALGASYPDLVPPSNAGALAAAVLALLDDHPRRTQLGDRNRARAAALFSPGAVVTAYESLVSRLLRPGRAMASA